MSKSRESQFRRGQGKTHRSHLLQQLHQALKAYGIDTQSSTSGGAVPWMGPVYPVLGITASMRKAGYSLRIEGTKGSRHKSVLLTLNKSDAVLEFREALDGFPSEKLMAQLVLVS